jgi:hypothetical protein
MIILSLWAKDSTLKSSWLTFQLFMQL